MIVEEAREFQKISTFVLTMLRPLTVWVKTNCGKFFKKDGNLTCLLRNLYVDQEAAARTHMEQLTDSGWRRSTTRLFIVTLFNLCTENIMGNDELDELQAGIKTAD